MKSFELYSNFYEGFLNYMEILIGNNTPNTPPIKLLQMKKQN
jgi:hypothetical protein